MRRQILALGFLFLLGACTNEDSTSTLDDDLRFTINTTQGSQGISSYRMPLSDQYDRIPQDPNNQLTDAKVELGRMLFHEPGFGTVGEFAEMVQTYSCASCHHAGGGFQANISQGIGDGGIGFGIEGEGRQVDRFVEMSKVDVQPIRTPAALNTAFQTNMFWNGQFGATAVNQGTESLWPDETPIATNRLGFEGVETQAIAGLAIHRHLVDEASVDELGYRALFDRAFANIPNSERYTNITAGLAIAAYERTILAYQSPFQKWLRGGTAWMSDEEKEGAILFFGKGNCASCHNGPGLAAMEFYALGFDDLDPASALNFDPSDPIVLGRGGFTKSSEDDYKFKVPQLYNLRDSPFYGHGSSFTSIRDVIAYKNEAIASNPKVPNSQLTPEFVPLGLSEEEIDLLTAFIDNALYDAALDRYVPVDLPSDLCFPNNDWKSKEDMGCN